MAEPDLYPQGADDVEAVVVAWLTPLRRTAVTRAAGDELPFTLVRHITGSEELFFADPVVSIHTLCDRALGDAAAAAEAQTTHLRMLQLKNTIDWTIVLPNGREAAVDYVTVTESPHWEPYSDQILRKVGTYRIGLTYTDQPGDYGS